MHIGLMMDSLTEMSLEEALDAAASLGIEAVEIPLGNWSPAPHVDFEALVADPGARRRLVHEVESRGMTLDSLNASGNQLHPVSGPEESRVVQETIRIAGDLGITKVVLMSGLPGAPGDSAPNWITSSWPAETGRILEYQWSEVAIPWWHRLADHARACGVTRLALELHPGQLVYNVRSFRRLRAEIGDLVGVNMDPSHLFWMGADPLAAIDALGDAVYHVHAKDTRIEPLAAVDSCYETLPMEDWQHRAWNYVALGRGQAGGVEYWRAFVERLRGVGYDGILSIEHEDASMTQLQGVTESVEVLREVLG